MNTNDLTGEVKPRLPERCDECVYWYKFEGRNLGACMNSEIANALATLRYLEGCFNATLPNQTCGKLLMERGGARVVKE